MPSHSSTDSLFGGLRFGLFSNQIVKVITLVIGCSLSIVLAMQVANPDTNGIATLLRWVTGFAFVASVISPKKGIFLVLLACPVLDLIKRLLVLYSSANMLDVTSVLALAPGVMAGSIFGTFCSRLLFKKKMFEPGEGYLFAVMAGIASVVALSAFLHASDSMLTLLKNLGESCVYLGLIFLVSVHFRRQEDIAQFLRLWVALFVPVALYGFWQRIFGLANFEERYLLSGLTITLDDYLGSARIFSTLNSNHSFSVTMSCSAILALTQRHLPAHTDWQKIVRKLGLVCFVLFSAASLISLRRTGWLVILVSLVGIFCFNSPKRTYIFYSVCVGAGMLIILNASYILTMLPYWDDLVQSIVPGTFGALHLQTFNDRLYSFVGLTQNGGMWTLFGLAADKRGQYFVHDAISETLIAYGAVPLFVFVVIMVVILRLSHRLVWREQDKGRRKYVSSLLSLLFANIFVGALMQSHIGIFPINFIFWFCAGALLKIVFQERLARITNASHEPAEDAIPDMKHPLGRQSRLVYGH